MTYIYSVYVYIYIYTDTNKTIYVDMYIYIFSRIQNLFSISRSFAKDLNVNLKAYLGKSAAAVFRMCIFQWTTHGQTMERPIKTMERPIKIVERPMQVVDRSLQKLEHVHVKGK